MSKALNEWLGLALFTSFYVASMACVYRVETKHKLDGRPRWRITIIQAQKSRSTEAKKICSSRPLGRQSIRRASV